MNTDIEVVLQLELGKRGALGGAAGGAFSGAASAAGGAVGGNLGAKWMAGKLKTQVYSDEISITDMDLAQVGQQLNNFLQDTSDGPKYMGVVGSGFGGMNPAYILAMINTDTKTLFISAYAKEGLIKQHTAEKAVKALIDHLKS